MKKFTKSTMATALQVMAVLILFGYPGCSSTNHDSKEMLPVSTNKNTAVQLKKDPAKSLENPATGFLFKQKTRQ